MTMIALAQEAGDEIARRADWQKLLKSHTAASPALPGDFQPVGSGILADLEGLPPEERELITFAKRAKKHAANLRRRGMRRCRLPSGIGSSIWRFAEWIPCKSGPIRRDALSVLNICRRLE